MITVATVITVIRRNLGVCVVGVSHQGLNKPTCHADVSELHAEITSAALNEPLHLGYVTSKLGLGYPQPIMLEVDNATAITFSKDQVRRLKLRYIDCRQA